MVHLKEFVRYCDELLNAGAYRDYAPNGLQVEGGAEVKKVVAGVTASQALIDAAIDAGADLLLVHHGFFWKNEAPEITGLKRNRIAALINNDVSLVAYHLPLDGHAELGNNAQLARILDLNTEGRFGRGPGDELAMFGRLNEPLSVDEFAARIDKQLHRPPLVLRGGDQKIERVAWCSGAAQGYIEQAYELGVDAFISGEVSESTVHFVRESGVHYFASGHHATERYGVQALAEHLASKYALEYTFIDIDNPV